MNLLDRTISYLAPEWGARRLAARSLGENLATYSDALTSKLVEPSLAPGTSADWDLELGRDRRFLVDRVRQAERDNPFVGALLDRSVESVVGHGFRCVPRTKDKKWNAQFTRLWREWCRKSNCHNRGLFSLHKQAALNFRGYLRDGEAGWIKLNSGKLRCLESDEIGSPQGYIRPGAVDGIILDKNGEMKEFHVFTPNMWVLSADRRISGDRTIVSADDVIFWARRVRTSQTRGLTAFNGVFWALDQIKGSIEAMTVALRMAACIGLIIKRTSPFQLPTSRDAASSSGVSRTLKLAPGNVMHLMPGEDVTQVTPTHPGPMFEGHVRLLIRIACTPFGLPLEVAMGDFGPLNLSSARANLQQACRTWRGYQGEVEAGYNDVADWKGQEWIDSGELWEVEDWKHDRHWVKPKWMIMDPVAEAQADIAELDAGLATLAQKAEERGMSLEELIEQRKLEKEMLEDAGLELPRSTLMRPVDQTPDPATVTKPQSANEVKAYVADRLRRVPSSHRRVVRALPVSKSTPHPGS